MIRRRFPSIQAGQFSLVVAMVAGTFFLNAIAVGDQWPQWMGPQRDNVWREEGIVDKFPAGGPKVLWRAAVAGGYAGVAVAEGKVFVTDFVPGGELPGDNFERKTAAGTERVL